MPWVCGCLLVNTNDRGGGGREGRKVNWQGRSYAADNLIITPEQVFALSNSLSWHNFANRLAFTAHAAPTAPFPMVALKMISASRERGG